MTVQAGLAARAPGAAVTQPCDSDALLPLAERLARRAQESLDLHAESTQLIRIIVSVTLSGLLSHRREAVILRIAETLLFHLVRQAMHVRVQGRIALALDPVAGGHIRLSATHDGWNLEAPPAEGWLRDVGALGRTQQGSITMGRDELSHITLLLPRENPYLGAEH